MGRSGTFTAKNGAVVFKGKSYSSPVTLNGSSALQYGSVKYGGQIVLAASKNQLTVINQIDLEQYLRGILKMEMNHQWPMEALKTQAVISRTFALRGLNRHGSAGYDLCKDVHCQVYRGLNAQDPRCDQAVASTRGQVLTYNGALAETFFHSYSGGNTADVSHVWGATLPYLTVRPEPFDVESPRSQWTVSIPLREIQSALSKKGIALGNLTALTIVRRDSAGRAVTLRFDGTAGSAEMSSHSFRMAIGPTKLCSTAFELDPSGLLPKSGPAAAEPQRRRANSASALTPEQEQQLEDLMNQKKFSSADLIDMLINPQRRSYYLERELGSTAPPPQSQPQAASSRAAAIAEITGNAGYGSPSTLSGGTQWISAAPVTHPITGNSVTFWGRGWGHGVGLSQWGAKAMADHGWTFQRILEHYYPGTALQQR